MESACELWTCCCINHGEVREAYDMNYSFVAHSTPELAFKSITRVHLLIASVFLKKRLPFFLSLVAMIFLVYDEMR